jgi:hypothetical protein
MRRTLASLLFGLAYACASLTVSGFLLQRTAFDPDRSADAAGTIIGDNAIKRELVDLIAAAATEQLAPGDAAAQAALRTNIDTVATLPAGHDLLAEVVRDAHARLIGAQETPVQITGQQLVQIVRDERAAALPAITLPVPTITALDIARTTLRWLLPITAVLTVVLVALGFAAHPERSAVLRSLALGMVLLAVLTALLGYLIPKLLIPVLDSSPWANVPARLADDSLPLLIGLELVLIGGALALWAGSGMARRRDRWRSPVSSHRYTEERRWS